jgi:transketolase N-terminal domain/subunit
LKKLRPEELPAVCAELRQFIIEALSKNPGHLASSLGAIELTVALHYVFDTPQDKLVWDVGHQAYAHKILTGRRDRFHTNRQFKGLSPFTNPKESEYDAFIAGHASNSISAALGLDIADRFAVRSSQSDYKTANAVRPASPVGHNVVAIIGDGAMTGGLAFEGLNNTSMDKNNLLIVLNDNNMAIDPLKGGFTQYLVDLTTSAGYNKWRWRLYKMAAKLHLVDERKRRALLRRNNNLKALVSKQASNIFTGLNIRYFGPTDGHDVEGLVRILSEIKNHRGPKVLHIITKKGKGYAPAENDQTVWHAPGEFNVANGERLMANGEWYEADRILVSVGRRANMQGLEALTDLEMHRGGIVVDEFMKTNLENVYACGDVTGKIMLAHVASRQAEVCVGRMLRQIPLQRIAYNAVPSVVYTNPEIASVGLTEEQVRAFYTEMEGQAGLEKAGGVETFYEVRKLPMTFSGRFMAENDGETGLCKMLIDRKNQTVLGVHMIGNPCSEFVAAASFAVRMGYTVSEMEQVIFPHPTVSEILHEVL